MDLDEEQDDDHLDEADEFEKDYNFRFEVEEGRPGVRRNSAFVKCFLVFPSCREFLIL